MAKPHPLVATLAHAHAHPDEHANAFAQPKRDAMRRLPGSFLAAFCLLVASACAAKTNQTALQPPAWLEPTVTELAKATTAAEFPASTRAAPTRQVLESIPLAYATTSGVSVVSDWGAPPYPAPLALRPTDHFYFQRPLATDADAWLHPSYRYGNTHFGEEPTHTGVDIVTDMWTPVLAAGDGVVVWTGYGLYRGIEDETDPYGLAIAIEHEFGYEGEKMFTVYGHLSASQVVRGQPVEVGQVIGKVGNTGEATGPHLHFEVRIGENRYFHTYNPELWMVPQEGTGVLAGRIFDSWNRRLEEYPVRVVNLDTKIEREIWTYAKDTVHPDRFYDENFVMGDLPAGPYEVYINYVGHKFAAQFYLWPGQTNTVTFRGRDGFEIDPTQD